MSPSRDFHLRLFVAGNEPNSRQTRQVVEQLCATRLRGRSRLEVVDVLKDFQAALDHHVLVAPTLIISGPHAPLTLIGNLQDPRKLIELLGLAGEEEEPRA